MNGAKPMPELTTRIATSDAASVTIRGKDLVGELIGQRTFTEMVYLLTCGREPGARETKVLDACLVTLMEHGFTPAALVTRITADSVPDQVQVAMAAGLLTIGSVFVGTMEGCAALLQEGMASPDQAAFCTRIADEYLGSKRPIPGFGHPFHKPDDPRTPALFAVAQSAGVDGRHIALLQQLSRAVDARAGRHLTINATGAIGALLLEIGVPPAIMRAIAVISRCGGLAGHIIEERETRSARAIWKLTEENIPYAGTGPAES
jgi:citrate synthase